MTPCEGGVRRPTELGHAARPRSRAFIMAGDLMKEGVVVHAGAASPVFLFCGEERMPEADVSFLL